MNLFPHNDITINKQRYTLAELQAQAADIYKDEAHEFYDFWAFVYQWLDTDIPYIEVKTSGSTGTPKRIRHSKQFMLASAQMTCTYFDLNHTHKALICLSPKHIGGMMMVVRALYAGMSIVLQAPSNNPLAPLNGQIDFVAMVPYQVAQAFECTPEKWKWIDKIIIGGGAVLPFLEQKIKAIRLNAYHTFGMTETISHIALRDINASPYFEVLDNIAIRQDERGCLVIAAPLLHEGEVVTNDLIALKGATAFEWLGRIDNAIETGGFKVLPEVVERKLTPFFPANRFFISSLPDSQFNNKVVLLVEGAEMDLDTALFSSVLLPQERPKSICYLSQFCETATGKVNRRATVALLL